MGEKSNILGGTCFPIIAINEATVKKRIDLTNLFSLENWYISKVQTQFLE